MSLPNGVQELQFETGVAPAGDSIEIYGPGGVTRSPCFRGAEGGWRVPLDGGISRDMRMVHLQGLRAGFWDLQWWNPRSGVTFERQIVEIGEDGRHLLSNKQSSGSLPSMEDWVLASRRA